MISFPKKPVYNTGGFTSIEIIPNFCITKFPNIIDSKLSGPIEISSFASWILFPFSYESLSLSEEMKDDNDNGDYNDLEINLFIPGDNPEVKNALNRLIRFRFVAKLRSSNGSVFVCGNTFTPLKLTFTSNSGTARKDRKGFFVKLYGRQLDLSPSI